MDGQMTYENDDDRAKQAKIRGMAVVMALKYHAWAMGECNRQLTQAFTEYAANNAAVRMFDWGEAMADFQCAATGYPYVLMGHAKAAAILEGVADPADEREIAEAYRLAVKEMGVPDDDRVQKVILFR